MYRAKKKAIYESVTGPLEECAVQWDTELHGSQLFTQIIFISYPIKHLQVI